MDKQIKILVAGDVSGHFNKLFKRVDAINKKSGPFELLLCVGDFFSADHQQNEELTDYKSGQKTMPTFVLGGNTQDVEKYYADNEGGELCPNLTYLGKRGLYTLGAGVKIAYVSGVEHKSEETVASCNFTKDDILAVRNSCLIKKSNASDYRGVDILLTSLGPYGLSDGENLELSKLITYLCKEVKPRYHFFGRTNKYMEAQPYRLPSDHTTQLELCVRIIGLASVANASKEKYIYALSLTPVEKMRVLDLIQKTTIEKSWPPDMTSACQSINMEIKDKSDNCQYFFDMKTENVEPRKRLGDNNHKHAKKPRIMHIDQEICWFCLSCPNVEKHLIITVGEYFYLALAKGPINDYHALILSISHIPAASHLSDNEEWRELLKFKQALKEFFTSQGQVVCFTERNYKSSHLQINCLGIEEGYAWKIEHTFEDKAEEFNLEFEKLGELKTPDILPRQGPYFVAELPNGTVLITRQMKRFPLHFARDVFCNENLLNCDEKVDWHDCKLDKESEIELVSQFREKFKKFDFTL